MNGFYFLTMKFFRSTLKGAFIIAAVVFSLLYLLLLLLNYKPVRKEVVRQIGRLTEKQLGQPLLLKDYSVGFPVSIHLQGILFCSPAGDTIISSDYLYVNPSVWKFFLEKKIYLHELSIQGVTTNLVRKNGKFNFDFLTQNSAKEKPKEHEKAKPFPYTIYAEHLRLSRVKGIYVDDQTSIDIGWNVEYLKTEKGRVELSKQLYEVGSAHLRKASSHVYLGKSRTVKEADSSDYSVENILPRIKVGKFHLEEAAHSLRLSESLQLEASLDTFRTHRVDVHLSRERISAGSGFAAKPTVQLKLLNPSVKEKKTSEAPSKNINGFDWEGFPWTFELEHFAVRRGSAALDLNNSEPKKSTLDFEHLAFNELSFNLHNSRFKAGDYLFSLKKMFFRERSGLEVQDFACKTTLHSDKLRVEKLFLQTENSKIDWKGHFRFASANRFLSGKIDELHSFDWSTPAENVIGLKDLELIPGMPAFDLPSSELYINAGISGEKEKFHIRDLEVQAPSSLYLKSKGEIRGDVTSLKKIKGELQLDSLFVRRSWLLNVLDSLPLQLPDSLYARGKAEHFGDSSKASVKIRTNRGQLAAEGQLINGKYGLSVRTGDLQIGEMLRKSGLGNVSLSAKAQGTGLPFGKESRFTGSVSVSRWELPRCTFDQVNLLVKSQSQHISGDLSFSGDGANGGLYFQLDSVLERPRVKTNGVLKRAQLDKFIAMKDSAVLALKFEGQSEGKSIRDFSAKFRADSMELTLDQRLVFYDSLISNVRLGSQQAKLHVVHPLFSVDFSANKSLDVFRNKIFRFVNRHLYLEKKPEMPADDVRASLEAKIDLQRLKEDGFIPFVDSVAFFQMSAFYDEEKDTLHAVASIPSFKKSRLKGDSLKAGIFANHSDAWFFSEIGRITFLDTISVNNLSVSAESAKDTLLLNLKILDPDKKKLYDIKAQMMRDSQRISFHLLPEQLINKKLWTTRSDNIMSYPFNSKGLYFKDFGVEKENEQILVQTEVGEGAVLNKLTVKDLRLDSLSRHGHTWLLGGLLNHRMQWGNGTFAGEMSVKEFGILGSKLGNWKSQASRKKADAPVTFFSDFSGALADLSTKGMIGNDSASIDLDAKRISLAPVRGLTDGLFYSLGGTLRSKLHLSKKKNIHLLGYLAFDSVRVKPRLLNTELFLHKASILSDEKGLHFRDFTIRDEHGHGAALKGSVFAKHFTDYRFDLEARIENFMAMNSTAKDNPNFYGKLYLENVTRMKGPYNNVKLSTRLQVKKGTDLHYVFENPNNPNLERGEGVVEFVVPEKAKPRRIRAMMIEKLPFEISGEAKVHVDPSVKLNIVLDPFTNSTIHAVGGGNLSADYRRDGTLTLTGVYEVHKGSYQMYLYNLIGRRLAIQKGSKITWTGEIDRPLLDIRARYKVKASPIGLLTLESNLNPDQLEQYSKFQTFYVNVMLKGEALKPDISFNIEYPAIGTNSQSPEIITAINQLNNSPEQLNKQAFSLILIQAFVSRSPFSSFNKGNLKGNLANILTQQLNRLSSNLIKGTALNFNIESYNLPGQEGTSNERTDVGVSVKQQLFKNRLVINVGGTYSIDNANTEGKGNANTNNIVGDVVIDYKITKDGKYQVKVFRMSDNGEIFNSTVVKTGFSVLFKKAFPLRKRTAKNEKK
ncbi:MAG: translocation/assembly module TamB [Cytophagales bacterium]|nr:translocation/assembly module TamB [Cytophagales bacterium]